MNVYVLAWKFVKGISYKGLPEISKEITWKYPVVESKTNLFYNDTT